MESLNDYPQLSEKLAKIIEKIPKTPDASGKYVRFISLSDGEITPFMNFVEAMGWSCYEISEPGDSEEEFNELTGTTWGLEIPAYKLN